MRRLPPAAALLVLGLAVGCANPPPARVLSVTVEASEPLSDADVTDFRRLAEALPDGALAGLAAALPGPPHWPGDSTRTVADLAAAEADRLTRDLRGPALATTLAGDPGARRLLDDLGWSAGRFASVAASLGVAAVAADLPDDRRLRRWLAGAEADAAALAADGRVFSRLIPAERASVLRRAACLPRRVLLAAALAVPPGNRAVAAGPDLAGVLPAGFDRSALDRLLTDSQRHGVPFRDPDPARDDAALRWTGRAVVAGPPR